MDRSLVNVHSATDLGIDRPRVREPASHRARHHVAGCTPATTDSRRKMENSSVKFSVDRDVLADAVAWAARSLPVRPSAPVLAGLLIDATTTGWSSPPSTTRPRRAPRCPRRSPTRAGPSSAAGCSPTSAAASGQAGRDDPRGHPRAADLRGRAVQPADDAGRGLPDAARRCRPRPGPSTARFAHAVAQAVTAAGRDDMLPVLTGVRHRDRRARPSACWRPTGSASPTASSSGRRTPPTSPRPRWSRPGCSATPPSR